MHAAQASCSGATTVVVTRRGDVWQWGNGSHFPFRVPLTSGAAASAGGGGGDRGNAGGGGGGGGDDASVSGGGGGGGAFESSDSLVADKRCDTRCRVSQVSAAKGVVFGVATDGCLLRWRPAPTAAQQASSAHRPHAVARAFPTQFD